MPVAAGARAPAAGGPPGSRACRTGPAAAGRAARSAARAAAPPPPRSPGALASISRVHQGLGAEAEGRAARLAACTAVLLLPLTWCVARVSARLVSSTLHVTHRGMQNIRQARGARCHTTGADADLAIGSVAKSTAMQHRRNSAKQHPMHAQRRQVSTAPADPQPASQSGGISRYIPHLLRHSKGMI